MTFLKKLIVILHKGQSYTKIDKYESKKFDDFYQSQKIDFVCR